jgi:hypothetical protein
MAEGLLEIYFRRTPMRTLALLLVSMLPCAVVVTAPFDTPSSIAAGRPIHLSLMNMSAQRRQVRWKSGIADLPIGVRVNVDSQVGAILNIVSDTDESVNERIVVKSGDDVGYLAIR